MYSVIRSAHCHFSDADNREFRMKKRVLLIICMGIILFFTIFDTKCRASFTEEEGFGELTEENEGIDSIAE